MKNVIAFFIGLLLIILDGTIFADMDIFSLSANVVLAYICIISIYSKKYEGIVVAVALGFMRDILYSRVLGLNALIFLFCAYFIYKIKDKIFSDSMMTIFVVVFFSTIAESLFSTIFLQDFLQSVDRMNYAVKYYLMYPFLNGFSGMILFLIMKKKIIKILFDKR